MFSKAASLQGMHPLNGSPWNRCIFTRENSEPSQKLAFLPSITYDVGIHQFIKWRTTVQLRTVNVTSHKQMACKEQRLQFHTLRNLKQE